MRRQRGFIDPELLVICTLAILLVSIVVALLWWIAVASAKEEREWQAFKTEHHCKVVGRVSGSTDIGNGITFDSKGNAMPIMTTTYTPPKTGWQCNDGITYWR